MLFVIDMQNDYVDKDGNKYIEGAERLVPGIIGKIMEYENKNDHVFYTSDINLQSFVGKDIEIINNNDKIGTIIGELKSTNEEKWCFEPYKLIKPYLKNHERIKKSYYAIPPEILMEIQNRFKDQKHIIEEIEFVGVETNICILANAICVQSAFPDAKIIIDSTLCKSKDTKNHYKALEVMEALGMIIRGKKGGNLL